MAPLPSHIYPAWSKIPSKYYPTSTKMRKKVRRLLGSVRNSEVVEPDEIPTLLLLNAILREAGYPEIPNPNDPSVPAPPPDPVPGVYGPYTTQGAKYWLQIVEIGQDFNFYVWFDVDPDDGPDVRIFINDFLSDAAHTGYRQAIRQQARRLNWDG